MVRVADLIICKLRELHALQRQARLENRDVCLIPDALNCIKILAQVDAAYARRLVFDRFKVVDRRELTTHSSHTAIMEVVVECLRSVSENWDSSGPSEVDWHFLEDLAQL